VQRFKLITVEFPIWGVCRCLDRKQTASVGGGLHVSWRRHPFFIGSHCFCCPLLFTAGSCRDLQRYRSLLLPPHLGLNVERWQASCTDWFWCCSMINFLRIVMGVMTILVGIVVRNNTTLFTTEYIVRISVVWLPGMRCVWTGVRLVSQSQFRRFKDENNSLPLSEMEPQTIQPVA
jgi:hypothetical protein